jgi:RNA polymerase sigma factor (sigma-70 family)
VAVVADEQVVNEDSGSRRVARQIVEDVHALHGQRLWGFVRRQGLGDDEAAEVIQEALLRLWYVCLEGFPPDRPVAWTFRTAYRLAMDRHRWRRRLQEFLSRQTSARPHQSEAPDELLAVWAEVDRLPERQRHVLYLRYRADLTFEDIGKVLGIDSSSARSNASRGIASLRDRLARKED